MIFVVAHTFRKNILLQTYFSLFRERWTSIVQHVTDVHQWDTATVYHKCAHGPLEDENRENLWMKPGSPSHKLLQDIVFDVKLLKAIDKLTQFCHTGPLEVAHSLYLKYCPKRQHFSYKGMFYNYRQVSNFVISLHEQLFLFDLCVHADT